MSVPKHIVQDAVPETIPAIREILGPLLDEGAPYRAHWQAFLDQCAEGPPAGLVAFLDGHPVGLAQIFPRVMTFPGSGRGRVVLYLPTPDRPAAAYGLLIPAVDRLFAGQGLDSQYVCPPSQLTDIIADLTDHGFKQVGTSLSFTVPTNPPPAPPVDGLRLDVLSGSVDEALLSRLSAFCGRGLSKKEVLSDTDPDSLRALLATPDFTWIVAIEEASGDVVGAAELNTTGFFSFIAVARSYWGSPLTTWLTTTCLHYFRDTGHDHVTSAVRTANAASIALHKRFNAEQMSETTMLSKAVSTDASRATEEASP